MGGIWECLIRSAHAILSPLLKTHSCSLDDKALRILIIETESIINSQLLTVKVIGDVNSKKPLSASNLLAMKLKVIGQWRQTWISLQPGPVDSEVKEDSPMTDKLCAVACQKWRLADSLMERLVMMIYHMKRAKCECSMVESSFLNLCFLIICG